MIWQILEAKAELNWEEQAAKVRDRNRARRQIKEDQIIDAQYTVMADPHGPPSRPLPRR